MNVPVPYVASAPIAPAMGLVPTTFSEAMKFAEMMASSKLVPAGLQNRAADCMMVIMQAVRWQMDPFAVAQECSVIQGKLMYSGKLVAAVVNSRGGLQERLSCVHTGTGDERTVTVSGLLQGEKEARTVSVVLKDARTNAAVWKTQPDQQLVYHGTRVWARRHMPELVLGVWAPDEFDEAPAATTPAPISETSPVQPAAVKPPPEHDPVTGETGPRAIALPKAETEWQSCIAWGGQYIQVVQLAATLDELTAWQKANDATLQKLKTEFPKIYQRIVPYVEAATAKLKKKAEEEGIPPFLQRKGPAPTPDRPEDFLAHISDTLYACDTRADVLQVWAAQFEPKLADMFPPDAAIAKQTLEEVLAGLAEAETEAAS